VTKIFSNGFLSGDVADDHYNRVKEDIQIMKELGISHYRMSFSWTRIFPTGEGRKPFLCPSWDLIFLFLGHVNQKGVDHYNMEINALLAAGITPFITLFHWDLPQPFQVHSHQL
jgi:beta-glucosidase/6-phospho-beta-glucosidase/beta-galactosidase